MRTNFKGCPYRGCPLRSARTANSGFTLLEVMIAIAVMGVLASIALPHYISYAERARSAACLANRQTINKQIMADMAAGNNPPESLADIGYPESLCPSGGVYVLVPADEGGDAPTVACSLHRWPYIQGGGGDDDDGEFEGITHDFANEDMNDYILVGDNWVQSDEGFIGSGWDNRLFTPNPYGQDDYSLTVTAQLNRGRLPYGYGIYFDTKVDESGRVESGYIMQFDPGMRTGELIIREWRNNRELYASYRFNEDALPDNGDPWWYQTHDVRIDVTSGSNDKKNLTVYVDGELMFDDFSFEPHSGETYTGFRVWGHKANTEFKYLKIEKQ